ncbi:MAG: hypothetical protein RR630_07425 [Coprobacillus sp.]
MRKTNKTTEEIVKDMLSKDSYKIWEASCHICSLSQNHNRVIELLPYKDQMISATKGIALGGALGPNIRFLNKAFDIISFHENGDYCPCCLLSEDSNPIHLIDDGYFTLVDTIYLKDSHYIDYYLVSCHRCHTVYKVEQREYHYTWWNWEMVDKE